jgi:hypothetical protein
MDEDTCPCGVPRSTWWPFHKTDDHDCAKHTRSECDTCKAADRMVAEVEKHLAEVA